MSETEKAKQKKFRSPPHPAIDLEKAIDRAKQLYSKAQGFEVGFKVLADAWSYGENSSGLWGTAAALIHYGLLEDQGSGKSRKFKLSDAAHRIIRDADQSSPKRLEAIRRAALNPTIFAELWEKFKNPMDLSDGVLKNYLTLDRQEAGKAPFSDSAADDAITAYRETIAFSGLSGTSAVPEHGADKKGSDSNGHVTETETNVQIGDHVQWTAGGVDQLKPARKVVWISDDRTHLRVHGSPTGIPMNEVTITEAPTPFNLSPKDAEAAGLKASATKEDINVYLTGKRLQITADVDLEGLGTLKKMLDKYEEILKLFS